MVAADTDTEANRLATSLQQLFLGIVSGRRKLLQPPADDMNTIWTEAEVFQVQQMLAYSFIGSRATIQNTMKLFLEKTKVNEVMATSHIYDQEARLHSYEIFAAVMQNM